LLTNSGRAEGLENVSPPVWGGLQRERGNGMSGFSASRALALASAALGLLLGGSGAWADACKVKPAQAFLGKPYKEALRQKAQAASHASLVQAWRRQTADFRSDRLNIIVDPKTNAVVGLWCG
jgi:hypothetical protein